MSKLIKREVLLLKVEGVYNTDANPTAATDALLVENLSWSLEGLRMVERNPIRPSLAKLKSIYAGSLFSVTFDVEIKGSGTAGIAPEVGQALRASGLGETIVALASVTYAPVSAALESATIYLYEDGSRYKITGCRGTVSGNIETGATGKLSFTFTGHLSEHIDQPFPSPSYDNSVPPPLINVPFTLEAFPPDINALSFDLGNEIATPPNLSSSDGFGEVLITARDVSGSFDPEATTKAGQDFLGDLQSSRSLALSCGAIGTTAGNQYQINMPAVSYRELSPGDRDGLRTYEIGFGASEVATDDEISITFT